MEMGEKKSLIEFLLKKYLLQDAGWNFFKEFAGIYDIL